MRHLAGSVLHYRRNSRADRNFKEFRNQHLRISRNAFVSPNDFTDQFGICIIGSDQVWSTRIVGGFNPIYFGEFASQIRKIGYAVSTAVDQKDYDESEQKQMAQYLENFECFSTREDSLGKILSNYSDKEITTVADPSLLLSGEEYERIAETPDISDYVLFYNQEYDPQTKNVINSIARQIGAKNIVVVTGRRDEYALPCKFYSTSDLSVPAFLGLVKNARCVFASSFHGTAFSLIFKKDFYFVANHAPDRARNLLSKVGALDRLIHSTDKVEFSRVDYSKVAPMLDEYKKLSMNWLINAIECKSHGKK